MNGKIIIKMARNMHKYQVVYMAYKVYKTRSFIQLGSVGLLSEVSLATISGRALLA
jgi:hypothetical protein